MLGGRIADLAEAAQEQSRAEAVDLQETGELEGSMLWFVGYYMSTQWLPAAATSSARLTCSWPFR
jgi:hypothetical protein